MGPTAPGGVDPRAQDMRDRLAAWVAAARAPARLRPRRRVRRPAGARDHGRVVAAARRTRCSTPPSGNAIAKLGIGIDDAPQGHIGSAFDGGFYGHVKKDLRQVLGQPVTDPWSRTYCGGGVLAACADVLWDALSEAAADLQTEFGSPTSPTGSGRSPTTTCARQAIGIATVPAFHWINRPTFQQVVQIGAGLRGRCGLRRRTHGQRTTAGCRPNLSQVNNDRNFIDNSPPFVSAVDDMTRANSDWRATPAIQTTTTTA